MSIEHFSRFADGTPVPTDGQFHPDPVDSRKSVRCLPLYMPPGVLSVIGGGNTARMGLLADGKVLKYPLDPKDERLIRALEIEDAILRHLGSHKRLVKYWGKTEHGLLFDRAQHGNTLDFISRTSVANLVHKLGPKWSLQAAEALDFIHGKDVIHCDIHPTNFLVDAENNLRLCDFAGSLYGELDGYAMESTRYFLPRDPHCPPTVRSDLFALGSTIYLFMTGHDPYHALSEEDVSARYEREEFPDVSGITLGPIILGCWERKYTSAYKVCQDVELLCTTDNPDFPKAF